jgi:acyl-CoA thioesterase I
VTRRALLAGVLPLAACGRKAPPADAPHEAGGPAAQSPPAVEQDTRPLIVAFGDSLTAGFGVDPGQSYPDFLQQELDRKGYRYRVVNQGSSGDTTSGGLARVSLAASLKPAIVILELGANDGLRGLPLAATRANLERLIEALKAPGSHVVLAGMTLPPNYGPEYIKPFELMYRELARKHGLPLVPFLLEGVGGVAALMQQDGLHPNVSGNRRVAETVFRTLEPLLRK